MGCKIDKDFLNFYRIEKNSDKPFIVIFPKQDDTVKTLQKWLYKNLSFIRNHITTTGGILLKGFAIESAEDFDLIAKIVEPKLCRTHDFDDSARMWFTENIYEAFPSSIKGDPFPVDYHNEDGFMPYVPSIIMLCSMKPADFGGESIFSDCRKVFACLPKNLQRKLMTKNIKNSFTFPDSVFLVNTRIPKNTKEIVKLAKKYGASDVHRVGDFSTRFTFEIPAVIKCDTSEEPVLFSRAHQADFLSNIVDIWYSYRYRNNILSTLKSYYLIAKLTIKYIKHCLRLLLISDKNRVVYSYDDGKKISIYDQIRIRNAHWKNSNIVHLEKGDIIILDNRLVTHGRLPYKGKRELLSCIGAQQMVQKYLKNSN